MPEPLNLGLLRDIYTREDIRPAAKVAQQDVIALLNRIGELEEAILGAAELLYPGDDWGPKPPGAGRSYEAYLSEGFHDRAVSVRDAWKARGWRRG